jgi:predicted ATPase
VLIVLDNFEQVVDAAGAIARLVNAAPEAKLLVTSRMRLGIRAEHEFFVAPLALPEDPTDIGALRANSAVRFFSVARLRRIRRSLSTTIPLAPPRESVRAWTDCRWRSSSRRRDAVSCLPERLRPGWNLGWTWCLAVDETCRRVNRRSRDRRWSVALLSDAERRVFARFGAFAGGASVAAAEWVCADSDDSTSTLDALTALVDASLLMREPAQRDDPRLRMLETVREFAMDALLRSSEKDAVLGRHA